MTILRKGLCQRSVLKCAFCLWQNLTIPKRPCAADRTFKSSYTNAFQNSERNVRRAAELGSFTHTHKPATTRRHHCSPATASRCRHLMSLDFSVRGYTQRNTPKRFKPSSIAGTHDQPMQTAIKATIIACFQLTHRTNELSGIPTSLIPLNVLPVTAHATLKTDRAVRSDELATHAAIVCLSLALSLQVFNTRFYKPEMLGIMDTPKVAE